MNTKITFNDQLNILTKQNVILNNRLKELENKISSMDNKISSMNEQLTNLTSNGYGSNTNIYTSLVPTTGPVDVNQIMSTRR